MKNLTKESLLLYAITDRTWLGKQTLTEQVEACLYGGATILQLREKDLSFHDFQKEALEIKQLCQKYKIPFIINDNIEIAVSCDADGIHIGQNDISVSFARTKLGSDKILGVSAQTVEQAVKAQQDGADYLGVGSIFSTSTKKDADSVSISTLQEICKAVSIPVIAIGGITAQNLSLLKGSGICGIAVISAIFAQPNIAAATSCLLHLTKDMVNL